MPGSGTWYWPKGELMCLVDITGSDRERLGAMGRLLVLSKLGGFATNTSWISYIFSCSSSCASTTSSDNSWSFSESLVYARSQLTPINSWWGVGSIAADMTVYRSATGKDAVGNCQIIWLPMVFYTVRKHTVGEKKFTFVSLAAEWCWLISKVCESNRQATWVSSDSIDIGYHAHTLFI